MRKSLSLFSYTPRSMRKPKAVSDPTGYPKIPLNLYVITKATVRAQGMLEVRINQKIRIIQEAGTGMVLAENEETGKVGVIPSIALHLSCHTWNPYLSLLALDDVKKLKRQVTEFPAEMQKLLRAAYLLRDALHALLKDEIASTPAGEHLRGESPFILLAGEMIKQSTFSIPQEGEPWHSVSFSQEIAVVVQTIVVEGNIELASYYIALRLFCPRIGVERAKKLIQNPLGELRESLFAIISTETQPTFMELPKESLMEEGQRVFKVPPSFFDRERMESIKRICK